MSQSQSFTSSLDSIDNNNVIHSNPSTPSPSPSSTPTPAPTPIFSHSIDQSSTAKGSYRSDPSSISYYPRKQSTRARKEKNVLASSQRIQRNQRDIKYGLTSSSGLSVESESEFDDESDTDASSASFVSKDNDNESDVATPDDYQIDQMELDEIYNDIIKKLG